MIAFFEPRHAHPVNAQGAIMLTADTITDAQICDLRKVVRPLGVADILCRIALGLPLPDKTTYGDALKWDIDLSNTAERLRARSRCAQILNARTNAGC